MARGLVEGQIVPPAFSAQLVGLHYVVAGSGGQTRRNQQECDQRACDLRQRKAFHSNPTSLKSNNQSTRRNFTPSRNDPRLLPCIPGREIRGPSRCRNTAPYGLART